MIRKQCGAMLIKKLFVVCEKEPIDNKWFEDVEFVFSNCDISLKKKEDSLIFHIEMKKHSDIPLWTIFSSMFDIIFLCVGKFPCIKSIQENDVDIDISNLLRKFTTSNHYDRDFFRFADVDNTTINSDTLSKMILFNHNNHSLVSLECLVCESYEKVLWQHKLTLMSHVIEGVFNYCGSNIEKTKQCFMEEFITNMQDEVGNYIAMLNCVFKRSLFKYSDECSQLLNALRRRSRFSFLQGIEQFRNFNSHMDNIERLSSRINTNPENFTYSYILFIAIRYYIMDECLNLSINDDFVKTAFITLCDYIMIDIRHVKKYKAISPTYMIHEFYKKVNELMTEHNSSDE